MCASFKDLLPPSRLPLAPKRIGAIGTYRLKDVGDYVIVFRN